MVKQGTYSINIVILRRPSLLFHFIYFEEPVLDFKCCSLKDIYIIFVLSELLMLTK
jgi:hypothetical protein